MNELNSVKVVIDGQVHELVSEDDPAYVQKIAAYIDTKIKEIHRQKNNGYINHRMKTLFISLNIADDLFKERQINSELKTEMSELTESLSEYISLTQNLKDENKVLKEELEKTQNELSGLLKKPKQTNQTVIV
ncbi:MAG: cell division protein ZapA [Defluviitaleaceae bacterium]|nr:cell division protein ZapA [Defluviitaleaceae bacterium]